jgi:aminoglycoside phosphotransferase family enzyme/predicted kinase
MGPGDRRERYAAVRETHVGVVVLLGEYAYKLKKPVDVGFLDFTTREKRLAACRREVDLNRRLAPDVYLGIADVSGPDGRPCDHMVVMRRMPDERRLSALIRGGEPVRDVVRRIGRMMAAFHASANRGPEISAQGGRDALRARWQDSFDQVRSLPGAARYGEVVAEIERLTLAFLDGRARLFQARVADGRIVDGHGDLLADDIFCLHDGPRVLDCLEFDDRLRWVDGLDDVAFLAMDLEHLGADELAARLLDWYAEFAADPAPASLRHHYVAYRAFVRAKVAWVKHTQGDESAADTAADYADLAVRHLRAGEVRLVVVGGLPGTGKSTLAGAIADRLGVVLLSSDRVRKELAGLSPASSAADGYQQGIYRPERTERTYRELLARADALLSRGESVVIDASWTSAEHRRWASAVAERTHSALVPLRCHAPAAVTAERMRTRRGSFSDATPTVAESMAAHSDPWPEATTVDTAGAADSALHQALDAVHPPEATATATR